MIFVATKSNKKDKRKKGEKEKAIITLTPEEAVEVIVKLSNQGLTPSEIGITLRDSYGIKNVKELLGKGIEKVLEEKGLLPDMPRDLLNLIRKSVIINRHMKANKHDMTAKRGYLLTVSKIKRLTKYYAKKGKLKKGWKYTPEAAELLVK